jgi:outer membrane protein OmpA-like peptidoglycan-associated protein
MRFPTFFSTILFLFLFLAGHPYSSFGAPRQKARQQTRQQAQQEAQRKAQLSAIAPPTVAPVQPQLQSQSPSLPQLQARLQNQESSEDELQETVQAQIVYDARYKSAAQNHRRGLYSKALESYRELQQNNKINKNSDDSLLLLHKIAECEYGLQKQSEPEPVTVTKLDVNINDPRYPSLNAFAIDDEQTLYFTSSRPRPSKGKGRGSSEKILDNVCIARRSSQTAPWGVASVLAAVGNAQFHQGVLGISPDEKDMFIFRGTNDVLLQTLDRTVRETKPVPIAKALNLNIDKRFHISSMAITNDRQTIYLCTDDGKSMGGYGRYDIWSITRDKNTNEWGEMVNMGPVINTAGDELSISILPDGKTIFFASDGHEGVGRCDIYRSTYVDSLKAWGKPVHLGYPINTPNDDIYYNPVFNNPNHAYYSVEKQDAPGTYDVYFVDYQGEILSPEEKEARRKAAEAAAKEAKQQEYLLALKQLKTTPVKPAEAKLIAQKGYSEFPKDTAVVGMKVLLRNIQFSKGQATLLPESYAHLEPLYHLMNMQPNIRIKISGHTDNTGKKAVNLKLSKERARSVANFLTDKGIDPARLEIEGYGQSQPITTNATEAGRNLNRRVEFSVIK